MAGEEMGPTEQDLLLAEALNYGIHEDQLAISTEATTNSANDNEIFKEVLQSSEAKISSRDQQIAELQTRLSNYELPYKQLAREIESQYPNVKHVTLARGQRVSTSDSDSTFTTLLLVESEQPINASQQEQLQKWLQVRLNTEYVEVIIK